ncbi:MAG: ABC transporter permease, partial [Enterorhabdus sp.]|nr:ABC transporter permease [Enterorhabdus sp.]
RDGLADAQMGLASAADAAQKALDGADASYNAVSQAADTAFATMKSDPAAAREVLDATASDVQSLQQAYQSMRDTLAAADPSSPALAVLNRVIAQLGALEEGLQAAEAAIGEDAATLDEEHQKVIDVIGKGKEALDASRATYNDQLKGELEGLSASLQKVGDDTSTLAASLQSTAAGLADSTDSLGSSLHAAEKSLRKTADTLRAAASQLTQARDDLHQALSAGDIDEVRRIIGNNPAAIAQFIAAPTKLEQHTVYPMADNGSAMSPFYTSLCLWIGAIFMVALMSVTVSPTRQQALARKLGRAARPAELYLGRYGVFGLIGLAQALVVGLGNVFFLGVECEHLVLYLAACCLASVVFTSLVYTLTVSFGNIGKAIAIIGLVLQLAGSGGLMPVQMLSAPLFDAIYPWLPFAHSMPALEGAMAGIYGNQYLVQMGLLAAFLVPSLILGLALRRPVVRLNDWVLAKLAETKFL